jgi:hypothetical protein
VWVKHLDIGGTCGLPAIKSALAKIDEVNSVVSHTADHIHKQINSPRILWTDSNIKSLFDKSETPQRRDDVDEFDSRSEQVLLKGKTGGTTDTLVGNLDPQTIIPLIDKVLGEIQSDYPEITVYEKIREQNIVTAPAARIMVGDVQKKLTRPAANYDVASVKLFQMGLAIGGWRARSGAWGADLTVQQQKFLDFDFSSYSKGELEMEIMPRQLIETSSFETANELQVRAGAVASVGDSVPLSEKFRMLGVREDRIPALVAEQKSEQKARQAEALKTAQAQAAARGNEKEDGNPQGDNKTKQGK